ncbi:hypothetical protein [Methanobrevibacter sp.]|uniref:hypothetical protein n=1 Tax=Methanobrevibacter sp. TaxID=66852 RepID=UPI00388D618B
MTEKELEAVIAELREKISLFEEAKKTKTKPIRLLRFAFNDWELRRLMKARRVKWNPEFKGWEFSGRVTREELGSHEYEIVEF